MTDTGIIIIVIVFVAALLGLFYAWRAKKTDRKRDDLGAGFWYDGSGASGGNRWVHDNDAGDSGGGDGGGGGGD